MRTHRVFAGIVAAVLVAACGGSTTPTTTSTTTTTAAPTTTTTTSTTTTIPAQPATTSTTAPQPRPIWQTVDVEVGPLGFQYQGGGEQERIGPTEFAVDPSGGVHIHDPVTNLLWSFTGGDEPERVDLASHDVLNVIAMDTGQDHLLLVEVFFAPVRHRVHRVGFDGALLESIEIPEGFRLEDGLSGIRGGVGGDFALELEGGGAYGVFDPADATFTRTDAFDVIGHTITVQPPDVEIDGTLITADLSELGLGNLRYLGTAGADTVVFVREDVTSIDPVTVLVTVEAYTTAGELLGSARIPLTVQAIDYPPGLTVAPDGAILALIAGEEQVRVAEIELRPGRITAGG